ncbi:replication-relaxation family protein [Microbacterium sp. LRZ72]|uniref:replication-relaxation family protein n=1 Tax=Microbacterium sp. LRZ72 TaxID=2942481 RepID=UPI0029A0C15C|nr:replication-relaxation family protein [Microbacterium sp. LRZ72]MDX2375639.1 replication-relaxation family protein [Microbacterium sp. LRZ72]
MSAPWNPYRIRDLEQHLSERDVAILENLERFRLLTTRQLQRLHFAASPLGNHATVSAATRATTRVLTRLQERSVITSLARRIGGLQPGSTSTVWQLAAAGERYLRARRGDPDRRKFTEPGNAFISHTLAVADVAVTVLEQARAGAYEVLELETEPTCWRTFSGSGATTLRLKPDLLIVTADNTTETHCFVEVDRGTEHLPAVVRKCQLYQRYFSDGTEERIRGLFPAVVWLAPDQRRAEHIDAAIRAERALEAELFSTAPVAHTLEHLAPYTTSLTSKGGTP